MGLDITVLAVDWERLERTPAGEREGLLYEAMDPEDEPGSWPEPEEGWVFPASPKVPFSGRYEFRRTLGSYKPHFWAADGWDRARGFADPALREPLDGFLRGLIWWGPDPDDEDDGLDGADGRLFPSDPAPTGPRRLLVRRPPEVLSLAAHWGRAAPRLEGLRDTYDARAARPGGWVPDFDAFDALLRQWAEVVDESARRGWGLLGLTV
ncbi:hypothetical protein [Streptomyces resistomycificus]|uniref:DUF1877 domain-containing protein n=1 Tax=Streptomyces resistomycificus TaxID=67356 RepID=A0A0L8LWV2_9ACTN|nr:hypothetical protein [Streptomyces resistomycificus]KOG42569.1 hypothetical protein ADK37_05540 [Streptomyces resistomycificus]KUN92722.1 hypothetical protein AQJ84_32640 [Streptomyces resistomycificus]